MPTAAERTRGTSRWWWSRGARCGEFELSAESQFPAIMSEQVDYQPDPPPPPVQPQPPADAADPRRMTADDAASSRRPIDDGLGDETEVPNL